MAIKTICHTVIIYYLEQAHLNMFPESRENLFLLIQRYHNRCEIATFFSAICRPRTVPAYQMKYLLRITMCIPKKSIPRNIIIVNCFSAFYYILYVLFCNFSDRKKDSGIPSLFSSYGSNFDSFFLISVIIPLPVIRKFVQNLLNAPVL